MQQKASNCKTTQNCTTKRKRRQVFEDTTSNGIKKIVLQHTRPIDYHVMVAERKLWGSKYRNVRRLIDSRYVDSKFNPSAD